MQSFSKSLKQIDPESANRIVNWLASQEWVARQSQPASKSSPAVDETGFPALS
jgi:hypothetical protein